MTFSAQKNSHVLSAEPYFKGKVALVCFFKWRIPAVMNQRLSKICLITMFGEEWN